MVELAVAIRQKIPLQVAQAEIKAKTSKVYRAPTSTRSETSVEIAEILAL